MKLLRRDRVVEYIGVVTLKVSCSKGLEIKEADVNAGDAPRQL